MDRIIIAGLVLIALFGGAITAHADDDLPKTEIVEGIWDDMWHGTNDDGRTFPEASFKRHLLVDWVNDNYGDDDYDWSNLGELKYEYADYYDEIIEEWSFHDDENGNWTIEDEDGEIFRFELIQGQWSMIDSNGATVDTFEPFSTLDDENKNHAANDVGGRTCGKVNGNDEAHRKAEEWVENEVTTTIQTEPSMPSQSNTESRAAAAEETEGNSSNIKYLAAGAALIALVGILAAITIRRK